MYKDSEPMDIFSRRLKEIREAEGFSQKVVADMLGIAVSTYANWEQGRRDPSISDIFRLLEVFGVEANELFDIGPLKK